MKTALITIGFDKNGEADFGVLSDITQLSFEQMQKLRAMIPVAIRVAENMWMESTMAQPGMLPKESIK